MYFCRSASLSLWSRSSMARMSCLHLSWRARRSCSCLSSSWRISFFICSCISRLPCSLCSMARDVPDVKTSVAASTNPPNPSVGHVRVMISPPLLELLISVPLGRSTINPNAKKEKGAVSGTGCRADKIKNRRRGDLIGATQGEQDELVALPRDGHHPILDSGLRQRLLQPLRLPLQARLFALGIQDEKRRCRGPDEIDGRGGLLPLIAAIHVPKAFLIVRQALSKFVRFLVGEIQGRPAHRNDPAHDPGREACRFQEFRVECHAGDELSSSGMTRQEQARGISSVVGDMRVHPGRSSGHVLRLVAPRNVRYQPVVDDGHTHSARCVKPSHVSVDTGD